MNIEIKTSAAIMSALLAEAETDRRRESLGRLSAACDALSALDASIKLTDVQKEIEKAHGKGAGPKAQSISNERLRPLGMYHYVEARERERMIASAPAIGRRVIRGNMNIADTLGLIDRISDMDVRSAVQDIVDRAVATQKALVRAKVLFKSIRPGADFDRMLEGSSASLEAISGPTVKPEQIAALKRLLDTLTDDAKLATVGLAYDGRRVRRRAGTRDELIDPLTLAEVFGILEVFGLSC